MGGSDRVAHIKLDLIEISCGFFSMQPGHDGILYDADGRPDADTLLFRDPKLPILDREALLSHARKLDFSPFVLVDCVWFNYYHWLCVALPKMILARHIAGLSANIVIPDYDARVAAGLPTAYTRQVWQQTLQQFGLEASTMCLAPGVYCADKIYTLRIQPAQPAFVSLLPDFDRLMAPLRERLARDDSSPKRLLVVRRHDPRLQAWEDEVIRSAAQRFGFVTIDLQNFDFVQQAQLFFNADIVVAPHGAGLSNLIFGRDSLRVLEINFVFPGETGLRPWFYLLAMTRNQTYSFLNAANGELAPERVETAFADLCSRPSDRDDGTPGAWWTMRSDATT